MRTSTSREEHTQAPVADIDAAARGRPHDDAGERCHGLMSATPTVIGIEPLAAAPRRKGSVALAPDLCGGAPLLGPRQKEVLAVDVDAWELKVVQVRPRVTASPISRKSRCPDATDASATSAGTPSG